MVRRLGLAGADPGFNEGEGGGVGQTSAYIISLLLLLNKFFFTRKSMVKKFAFVKTCFHLPFLHVDNSQFP